MRFIKYISLLGAVAVVVLMSGCDKSELYPVDVSPAIVHFDGDENQDYPVRSATVGVYNIEVGTSDVSSSDRTVTFNITSPTGAVQGTQYTLGTATNTIVIPAGESIGYIPIQGIFAGYPAGRVDTLVITLDQPSIEVAGFSDTVRLALGDICAEGVGFNINDFMGVYANTNETFAAPYGPYTTTISSISSTSATTATIVVENIWNNGWGPITFNLDWTNPPTLTAVVVPQTAIPGSDAGDINPAYAGQTIAMRAHATGGPGTFSSCHNTLTLKMQLGVTGLGYFAPVYTVVMAR